MIILTVAKGPDRGAVFEVRGKTRALIGRNSPDVPVTDLMVSRYHCRLKLEKGDWYVKDLGSRNGTRLNGERIQRTIKLKTGDLIATGYTELEVKLVPDTAGAVKPAAVDLEPEQEVAPGAASSRSIEHAQTEDDSLSVEAQIEAPAETPPKAEAEERTTAASAPAAKPADEWPPVSLEAEKVPEKAYIAPPPKAVPVEAAKPAGEEVASEWFSAVESQIVVAEGQGWDSELAVEGPEEIREANKDVVEVDERVRSILYFDDDEHWEDVDGDELPPHEDVVVKEVSAQDLATFLDGGLPGEPAEGGNDDSGEHAASAIGGAADHAERSKRNGKKNPRGKR
ncbi:MAG: FHA domain-containing protein [Phycisphaeraceae bacterium]